MERGNTQNKKRTRDGGGDDKKESEKGKKQESVIVKHDFFDINDHNQYYEFCDGIGVFDFPWLKEDVIFIADEYLEPEEMFAPCSYLDEAPGAFAANYNLDQSCVQSLHGYNFIDKKLDDHDRFWSLEIDDFESIDCIWSCLIDQTLDIGLNKG